MTREVRRTAVALAAALALLLAVAWGAGWLAPIGGALEQRRAGAAREALMAEVYAPVLDDPAFRSRAQDLDAAQQQALLFELARDGLVRLPDEVLLDRLALLHTVAARSDERICAMLLVGGTPDAAGALVAALDPDTLRRWLVLSRAAVEASLREEPPRPLAPADAERAQQALLEALGPAGAERFEAARRSLAGLSQTDACALARAALDAAVGLPPDERVLVARLFASG